MDDELPEGWTKHLAPSGHYYYNNKHTGESTYDRPVVPVSKKRARPGKSRRVTEDRPKFKVPLSEPWVLVVCRSGRRFVHNTETGESVWSGPTEVMEQVAELDSGMVVGLIAKARGLRLDERKDDLLKEGTRKDVSNDVSKEEPLKEDEKSKVEEGEALKKVDEADQPLNVEVEQEESEEESDSEQSSESEGEVEFESEDDEDEELSTEEKQKQFHQLLTDLKADPYGTWDTERDRIPGLVDDPRYDVYDSHRDRREQFDQWASAAIPSSKPPRRGDPVELFEQLLAECFNPKKHKFYVDFKRAMRKDDRFVAAAQELTDREREQIFRQHKNSN